MSKSLKRKNYTRKLPFYSIKNYLPFWMWDTIRTQKCRHKIAATIFFLFFLSPRNVMSLRRYNIKISYFHRMGKNAFETEHVFCSVNFKHQLWESFHKIMKFWHMQKYWLTERSKRILHTPLCCTAADIQGLCCQTHYARSAINHGENAKRIVVGLYRYTFVR